MKARVIATGDIIEVLPYKDSSHFDYYQVGTSVLYTKDALEFENVPDDPDYWTRLEHTYAGMAMQGLCANYTEFTKDNDGTLSNTEIIVENARLIAHALVEKYKKEE